MSDIKFKCNLCESENGKQIPFRYLFKGRYLWAIKCSDCSLVSIWPRPTDKEIEEMYAEEYFTGTDKQTHHMEVDYLQILSSGDYSSGVDAMKKYAKPGASILDVGCATGHFLYALKNAGYHVAGTELSSYAADYGNKNFNANIVNAPFDEHLIGNHFQPESFDVIMMNDVLEHFTHPKEALITANKLLKKGGVILIQLPGTLNLLSSKLALVLFNLLGKQKTMTIPPYHLTEFSSQSSKKMLNATGFTKVIIENEIKPPHTITLRGGIIENSVKLVFQYINYVLTKWFNIEGDRIHIVAYKS
jgi:2-polyprenyl-3-methyl-5-hydroxy-6-metoxy-1,4-benzoquinol methylase